MAYLSSTCVVDGAGFLLGERLVHDGPSNVSSQLLSTYPPFSSASHAHDDPRTMGKSNI